MKRQLKRYFREGFIPNEELHAFFEAVNSSYEHYERDHLLGKRSLEISSNEMRQLADTVSEKESYLLAILNSASDGILVVNEKEEIELCNPEAVRYLGFETQNDFLGKNISFLKVVPLDKNANKTTLSAIFQQSNPQSFHEFYIQDKPNLILELSVSKFKYINQIFNICILRDISKRKESEQKIGVRHVLTEMLFSSSTIEEAAPKVLKELCLALKWDLGFFWSKHSPDQIPNPLCYFDCKNSSSSTRFVNKTFSPNYLNNDTLILHLMEEKETLFAQKWLSAPNYPRREEALLCGFRSWVVVPLVIENEVFGGIELYAENVYEEDLDMKNVFHAIGSEIAIFIMQKNAQTRALDLQKQLMITARQASTSQVSTSVLHTVGNG